MKARRLTPVLTLAATLVCCASSQATFSPFTLVSGDSALQLQADYAYDPAVSADGNYVAYTGSIASKRGIYRTYANPTTGKAEETVPVALGNDTGAPSISENGRYVSFTTNDNPVTGEAPTAASQPAGECYSVYVRDMSKAPQEAGAYTLVSARDESSESLSYALPTPPFQSCGAASASRVAISADGNEIAFTVLSPSDLTGACTVAPAPECPTPPDQVAVRNVDTQRTTLVSVTRASLGGTPQPVPSGAAFAAVTVGGVLGSAELPVAASTAAISADGSTVAWMGIDIAEQAPVAQAPPTLGFTDGYAEPLWRRIAEGPAAPTRRVLAGDDASAPGCPPECSGGLNLEWNPEDLSEYGGMAPAYGSYTSEAKPPGNFASGGLGNKLAAITPQLSADGMKVALLSTQPDAGPEPTLPEQETPPANAFVVSMAPGLTRAQAIMRLTEWGSLVFAKHPEEDGTIEGISISPDGSRVAFTTKRSYFPLAPPALITPPVSQVAFTQLYEVDLAGGTLALVSQGYNGEPADGNVLSPALSGDGGTLALASEAGNLAFGAINKGSDVYVTHEEDSPAVVGAQSVTPTPVEPAAALQWSISATISHSADGALAIDVSVPGAGSLTASANASAPMTETVVSHKRRGSGGGRAQIRKVTVIATRQVAHAAVTTKGVELAQFPLTPSSRYRSLTYGKGGLYATITLTFSAHGLPRLTETLQASFVGKQPKPKTKAKTKSANRKPGKQTVKRGHK